jgi:hypothetical protein
LAHIGDKKEGLGGGVQMTAQPGFEGRPEVFDGVEVSAFEPPCLTNLTTRSRNSNA